MTVERTSEELAISDLIIARIRTHFQCDFIGSEFFPAMINNAALWSTNGRYISVWFSKTPDEVVDSHPVGGMYVSGGQDLRFRAFDANTRSTIIQLADQAASDFESILHATTHARRLVFLFGYHKQLSVSSDLRTAYLNPLLERFPGRLQLVDPDSYGVKYEINEHNVHPSGMSVAWEGEYVFQSRIPIAEISDALQEVFDCSLRFGFPTSLPVRELQGVPCAFTLTPRYF